MKSIGWKRENSNEVEKKIDFVRNKLLCIKYISHKNKFIHNLT